MRRVYKYEMVRERVATYSGDFEKRVRDSRDAARFLLDIVKTDRFTVEKFMVLTLNIKLNINGYFEISTGSLDSAPVHPREVFAPAVQTSAACILVAHNHPSGDATPSTQDIEVTERLKNAGDILGIKVIDHIVLGDDNFTSMKAEGYM